MFRAKQKRRDMLLIMAEILKLTKESPLKTQIMYKANLSFTLLNNYLSLMQNNNLIIQTVSEGKEVYAITEKGLEFLQIYNALIRLLKADVNLKKSKLPATETCRET